VTRFESVPNFSEGRDAAKVEAIVAPARAVAGVHVLDVELNADHNRAVVSLIGDEAPLLEATFQMIRVAVATIDLNHHKGEHPRMGAADVVPFIPLGTATMADAVRASEKLAERVWRELHLPVYLYAAAARRPERADLAVVRRGEFEGIRDSIASDPARRPDFGEARVHPTAGIVAIGARPVLIAYNAYLSTPDVDVAKKVARAVRARDGGLAEVKALGFDIQERHRAQVSMNLTDYRRTPVHRALEAVRREAARFGVQVEESEVVGLIPEDALLDAAEYYLQLNRFDRAQILERKIGGGPASPAAPIGFADQSLRAFSEKLAARTPTPGGGSAAAAAAAMGAALGQMVVAYSSPADGSDPELAETARFLDTERRALLEGIDEDSASFEAVRTARRYRKEHPDDPAAAESWAKALRRSAEVPLSTAQRARGVAERLERVRGKVKPTIASDLTTALLLLRAGADGALANVQINLEDLAKANLPHDDLAAELARLRGAAP
jgi:glutamate formiminotransferase / formiminotetrahydrofolate cyclodeaminase